MTKQDEGLQKQLLEVLQNGFFSSIVLRGTAKYQQAHYPDSLGVFLFRNAEQRWMLFCLSEIVKHSTA